jgi:penicillin-binding protein 1A
MGRDDNKVVPGLQGGRAPARAFHDFMVRAVANRAPENFDIAVQMPAWAVSEPDEETWFEAPDNGTLVNPDGTGPATGVQPLPRRDGGQDEEAPPPPEDRLDQDFIDRATDRDGPDPLRRRDPDVDRQDRQDRQDRRSARPPDPVERRPMIP